MLVVIDIRRVLESPGIPLDRDRNDPVVFSGRVVHSAKISLILHAELALGVAGLCRVSRRCDRLGVLLGLGEIDRDIELAVLRRRLPPSVLFDPVSADVIRIAGKIVIPLGGLKRILLVDLAELRDHFAGTGCHDSHDLCIKEIPHHDTAAVQHVLAGGVLENIRQDSLQKCPIFDPGAVDRRGSFEDLLPVARIVINAERPNEGIDRVDHVFLFNEACCQCVLCQISDCCEYLFHFCTLLYTLLC